MQSELYTIAEKYYRFYGEEPEDDSLSLEDLLLKAKEFQSITNIKLFSEELAKVKHIVDMAGFFDEELQYLPDIFESMLINRRSIRQDIKEGYDTLLWNFDLREIPIFENGLLDWNFIKTKLMNQGVPLRFIDFCLNEYIYHPYAILNLYKKGGNVWLAS